MSLLAKFRKTFFPSKNISSFFLKTHDASRLFTPIDEAVEEMSRRRLDKELFSKVSKYLNNDVPSHFNQDQPIFYLSRHLATPNFETLRTKELADTYGYKLVIGEDTKGIFVSNNELKVALGKLPVIKGISSNNDEIVEYFTIVDFNKNQGKELNTIKTKLGVDLMTFHRELFNAMKLTNIEVVDEASWIDKHDRDDIYKQYKAILALLCVHGIMLESYTPSEQIFVEKIVLPAFAEIEKIIGVRPLIVEHLSDRDEQIRNWNSYPNTLYPYIKERMLIKSNFNKQ